MQKNRLMLVFAAICLTIEETNWADRSEDIDLIDTTLSIRKMLKNNRSRN